jgi:hypothetical protein
MQELEDDVTIINYIAEIYDKLFNELILQQLQTSSEKKYCRNKHESYLKHDI